MKCYTYTCDHCGYEFEADIGIGFFGYHIFYPKLLEALKNGEYGEQGKVFFEEHPDGAFNGESVLGQCTKCKEYFSIRDLTLYLPERGNSFLKSKSWNAARNGDSLDYVSFFDLKKYYFKYEEYHHICKKCGGDIKIIDISQLEKDPTCPICKHKLHLTEFGYGD